VDTGGLFPLLAHVVLFGAGYTRSTATAARNAVSIDSASR
jgi:hypothetical protein